jgi:uncharacterized protein YkwD
MKRLIAFLFLFLAILVIPVAASAQLKPDDDPTITAGLRDKGVDWLKDQAKQAGKDWIFETGQSETMHEILLKARERADGEGNDKKGLCQYAVMGKASSILNDINVKWTAKTAGLLAFDTTVKMASLAGGFGAAAGEGNALNWLTEQYTDAAKDQAKDGVFDKIKKLFVDDKKPEFEVYETSGKNGDCDYTLRAIWDIVHGTYRIYISGDCHCAKVGQFGLEPSQLGEWWISFEGHLQLKVDKEKKTTSWTVLPPTMDFDAQCGCSKRKLRTAFAKVTKEQTSVTTGGGGGTGTPTGPPPLPPAGRKVCKECQKIQDEIDADTETLSDARREVDILTRQLEDAKTRLAGTKERLKEVKASPKSFTITPEAVEKQIQDIEAEIKGINAKNDKLYAEQVRLMAALRDLARQLEECLKKCAEGKGVNETPPIAPENKKKGVSYEPDPFAARILEIHNRERAAVHVPALAWNMQLAINAAAYAQELARTGQLVHAPREGRGIERENLATGFSYWSPDQFVAEWTKEGKYFIPGVFPNVCNTGGDCLGVWHYTQMIWPTTTDIGCGFATGGGYGWLVCRYSPGGNKDGKPVGMPYPMLERG